MSDKLLSSEAPLPPTLSYGDYTLRPFRLSDARDWSAYLSDPLVTRHTSWGQVDPATIETVVRRLIAEYSTGATCRLVVARSGDDRLVGTCGFKWWSLVNLDAELVYDLARGYWRRGIMGLAVETVLDWAFSDVGLKRVEALVMTTNQPSVALLERCGFTRESLLRNYRIAQGTPRDFYTYSRSKTA
jgi:ribosomal-protein-alanine N-acetyltransferase